MLDRKKPAVLVFDDDPGVDKLVRGFGEFDVTVVTSMDEFQHNISSRQFDAVVVDWVLGPPRADSDWLRRNAPKDLSVVYTAYGPHQAPAEPDVVVTSKASGLDIAKLLADRIEKYRTEFTWASAAPLPSPTIEIVGQELLAQVERDPELISTLDPVAFEHFVGDILSSRGFKVDYTARSHDGGVDIFAFRADAFQDLYIVQCKRYDKSRKVGVAPVRELYGVKHSLRATKAILATTSTFTRSARTFEEKHRWELELHDYLRLVELIRTR